ncbi:hypothetical protein [Nocardia farcinica]|uniref:hypothetical protein n=1 Tax=Nocardia farcinica TaxID=37329 RepID=UPI0024568CB7|nr:hypothetical protein [Nocardia farcinica]
MSVVQITNRSERGATMAARHSFLTYRETYGFPVTLTGRQVVLQVGTVGVVTMPEPVGSVVQNLLQPAQLAGPVFADPKAGRWVFLVDGVPGISPAQQVILGEVGVRVPARAEEIALPLLSESGTGPGDERRWLWPPGYELPQPGAFLAEVLGAARRFDLRERVRALSW